MMRNIMIIDDHREILDTTKQILEQNSYTVFTFDYFKVALKFYRLRHQYISIILLNMQLLDAEHKETIPSLFRINPDAKIIGMIDHQYQDNLEPEYQYKLRAFLKKPFPDEKLLNELTICAI